MSKDKCDYSRCGHIGIQKEPEIVFLREPRAEKLAETEGTRNSIFKRARAEKLAERGGVGTLERQHQIRTMGTCRNTEYEHGNTAFVAQRIQDR